MKKLHKLQIKTYDPSKYLLVNLEDGTFFQGQHEEYVDDTMIRRRSTLMWKIPEIHILKRALKVVKSAIQQR